ncbi:MAG: NADH dehydrogenase [Parcubacteria group bacterium Gr01-1014_18]|nr:MAG: NADH dehydrogenase [Parcubacteria group bacterium Greene0416_36]TSC81430.1 MAG: NADH dehydrogenase [Parcubacteria group bacterium Gr01-1014_18]TSC99028.1 MAG: NADH dehydrogenase [Parcubacteria group bacterium Greene1014_20]TSD07291.1 MAG: NADH dehydrogenase [Parcubacteria group bacterium Greene0714_2]
MNSKQRIVIAGAGFGGTYTYAHLHKYFHGRRDVELVIINKNNYFIFTPLLHEVATGGVEPSNIVEPLRKVCGCCLHEFHLGQIDKIDLAAKEVWMANESCRRIPYDQLVLALGATTAYYGTPGVPECVFTLKDLDDAIRIKNNLIHSIEEAYHFHDSTKAKNRLRFVIVGGGATGVELAAELADFCYETFSAYYPQDLISKIEIILLSKADSLLASFSPHFREIAHKMLLQKGVKVRLNAGVVRVDSDSIELDNGEKIETRTVIWVAGIVPSKCDFISNKEVLLDRSGRIEVNEYLQMKDYAEVYVLGDMACFKNPGDTKVVPALAQVATKQSKIVASNIIASIDNKTYRPFYYRSSGSLLSLGRWLAVAEIGSFRWGGHLAWWMWRTVYLSKLLSWSKKMYVAVDWTLNLFSHRDISEIGGGGGKKTGIRR